jgi:hypothetical protein
MVKDDNIFFSFFGSMVTVSYMLFTKERIMENRHGQ